MKTNKVTVRWFDGYMEDFEATEVRFGSDLLFIRLSSRQNRVRWFGMEHESHQVPSSFAH